MHAWMRALAVGVIGTLAFAAEAPAAPPPANPITIENAKPGSTRWVPSQPEVSRPIEGYTSQVSALPGDAVQVHVSTNEAAPYHLEVYRLGWYQANGGRLMECLPSCTTSEPGTHQPQPTPDPATGSTSADWPVTDTIAIPPDWVSGYYEIKLILDGGTDADSTYPIPLIVRQPPTQTPSSILVEVPVNTWEAYNSWGGKSLYNFNSSGTKAAVKVSFDRPYTLGMDGQAPWIWEIPFVHFLERNGYDVSYTTDVDVARDPGSLLGHRLVIVNGHDEYWAKSQRDGFEAARGAGVNLAFFGSNIGYWQVRYENGERTLVEYRSASADPSPDPATKTMRFRDLPVPRPECELLGIEYQAAGGRTNGYSPVPSSLSNPWFSGTGFATDSIVPNIVGYEPDSITPGCGAPTAPGTALTPLIQGSDPTTGVAAVTYRAPSGARVFATGSLQWNWALDDPMGDGRIQRFTQNALDDLSRRAPETTLDSIPSYSRSRSVLVSFSSSEPGASFSCRTDRSAGAWQGCASPTTYGSLPDGAHWFAVESVSASGVPDSTPAFHSFIVDSTPPVHFGLRAPSDGATVDPRPQLSWQGSSDSGTGLRRYRIRIDSSKVGSVRASRTTFTPRFDLAPGAHTWHVKAVDALGNTRESATRKFVTRQH